MNHITTFMGQPFDFWIELKERQNKDFTDTSLLLEIAELKRKVAMYERSIKHMVLIMEEEK